MYPSRPRFQVVPLAILACSLASTSPAQCAPGTPRHRVASDPATVSVAWLTQHFKDPGLVLMQVSDAKDYESAHIPGAQLIAFHDLSTPMESRPMLELPSVAFIDSVLSARGISNDSHVVVYWGGDWESPATRVVFTLDWAGLRGRVSLLDGGLTAWRAAGNPVTTQSPVLTPATFVAHPRSDVVVTAAWVRSHLHAPGLTLIDARDPEFYGGAPTKDSPHPGHIPGAVNLPFTSFTDSTEHFLP
ncbi:MAG: rhodanese-like domain-containing protein, partial [Gemmatimonadota bacterium]